ncbi:MAG: glycoside hydrolase family 2 protein [Acidobacteriaceae bacterium]
MTDLMRYRHPISRVLIGAILACCASISTIAQVRTINLDGVWRYKPEARTVLKGDGTIVDSNENLPAAGTMPIPSNWHLNGLPNFNGRVRFEREFDFRQHLDPDDRAFIVLHGVDYFATVEINGAVVGHHEGYFQQFEFDITREVRQGRNRIAITVDAPMEEPGTVWPDHKRLIKGIFSHWDCKPGSTDEKTGQDGTSAGIWNHVEIQVRHRAWLGVTKIHPYLYDRKEIPGHEKDPGKDAQIYISTEVAASRPGRYVVSAQIAGATASSKVDLGEAGGTVVLTVHLENPKLWWTWDLGEPYLYDALLNVADEQGHVVFTRKVPFGVRSITLDEATGEWRLNGVRFFIRGTNIVPDMWLAHYTPERIAKDIQLLKNAYINGVRICVHVNREELYDALDKAGIIAWQDFPLQWDYVQSTEFMQEAARQLRDMIRQFYNHPSIITWVCQNESTAYNVNVMDPYLAKVGAQEDSSRPVRPVSHFREHLYEGWYGGDYHNYAETPGGPIISELGAQALPSLAETEKMFGKTWPPDWKKLAYHDFQYDMTFHTAKLPMPQGWEQFVENSQRYQAELLKYAIEHYRRVKYQKLGSFFQFQFVDCWPSITWSVVSYDRVPKAAYTAMTQAYQPVLISADFGSPIISRGNSKTSAPVGLQITAKVWIINDNHSAIEGATYEAHLRRGDQDFVIAKSEKPVNVPADDVIRAETLYGALPQNAEPGAYDLLLTLSAKGQVISRNSYPVTVMP